MAETDYFENLFQDSFHFTFERAKNLRKEMTSAEKYLWEFLRNKQLGVKFRRQHPLAEFIADFYCHEKKLVIEVDGEVHKTQEEYDAYRSEILKSMGLRILRFRNEEVMKNIEGVIQKIAEALS